MFKSVKKVLVGVLAASLMLTSVAFAAESPADAPKVTGAKTNTVKVASNGKSVTVSAVKNNSKKYATVEAIKVNGKAVTVKLAANAFKKGTKKVTIKATGKVTVDKKAFAKLTKSQKKAVKVVISKKMKSANRKALIKALKKAGVSAKNISVK